MSDLSGGEIPHPRVRQDFERVRRALEANPQLVERITLAIAEVFARAAQEDEGDIFGTHRQGPAPPMAWPAPPEPTIAGPAPLEPLPREPISQRPPGAPPIPGGEPPRPPLGPPIGEKGEPIEIPREEDGTPFGEPIRKTAPLIFIPGILGSQLWRAQGRRPDLRVWPPVGSFGTESLTLLGVNEDKKPGDLFPGAYDELKHFIEATMGYVLNQDFFIFTYDWTQSNKISGEKLAAFTRGILSRLPGGTKCDYMCHSMGGIVVRAALLADKPLLGLIRRIIWLASPFFGSPQAYFALHDGISLTFKFGGFFRKLLAEAAWDALIKKNGDPDDLETTLKDLAKQLLSVYELLPDDFFFAEPRSILRVDGRLAPFVGGTDIVGRDTYSVDPRNEWALATGQDSLVGPALDFKKDLGSALPGNPRDNLVIYSGQLPTEDRVVYLDFSFPVVGGGAPLVGGGDRFQNPTASAGRGDATVTTYSGSAGLPPGPQVVDVGGTHNQVANSEATFRLIHNFLDRQD